LAEQPADKNRVYVCGMSMGAYGTLDVAGKYPNRIAAAVAICGGGSGQYACNLTQVPVWIQHGSADRAVPASESKKIYRAIKDCNQDADATLTIMPGGTHGSVERLFHGGEIYEFMFRHHKESCSFAIFNSLLPVRPTSRIPARHLLPNPHVQL